MEREEFIQQIKDCGKSIIDNAEQIYGNYKYSCGKTIIEITIEKDSATVIEVRKQFYPEQMIERFII